MFRYTCNHGCSQFLLAYDFYLPVNFNMTTQLNSWYEVNLLWKIIRASFVPAPLSAALKWIMQCYPLQWVQPPQWLWREDRCFCGTLSLLFLPNISCNYRNSIVLWCSTVSMIFSRIMNLSSICRIDEIDENRGWTTFFIPLSYYHSWKHIPSRPRFFLVHWSLYKHDQQLSYRGPVTTS